MERKRKIVWIAIFVGWILLILPFGVTRAQTTFKAITAWPKTASEYKAFTTFTDLLEQMVAKKAPGELKIQYIGGPEAVKTPDQIQALQRGMVDMVFTTTAYYLSVLPEVDAIKLSDFPPSEERANGAWAYINEIHEKKIGVHYLARLGLGIKFHLYLKKPIKTAELKGLNIRVSPMYLQMVKTLGGNPVVIPPTEVYVALERNVVDGYGWPSVGIMDWGWHKQTQYILEPGFYQVPNPLLVNLKTWNQLPPKMKEIMNEAAIEAEKRVVANFIELEKKERPLLLKEGIQVIELPSVEKEKFLKLTYESAWNDILGKCPDTGPKLRELLTKKK
jgi:TRAP-type C4-dicarboxylate transport system substrate-binding protein